MINAYQQSAIFQLNLLLFIVPEPIIPQELGQEYRQHISRFVDEQHGIDSNEDYDHITADLFDMPRAEKLPPITPDLLDTIRTTTMKLPTINLYLLNVLCQHLKRITNHANENKMTTSNLALIFIPTLSIGRLLFHCMVEHCNKVFAVPEVTSLPTIPLIPASPSIPSPSTSSASCITTVSAGPMQPCPPILNGKPLPPPLPHKPKHINIPKPPRRQNKSLDLGRTHRHVRSEHSKTLSDTDVTSMITPPLPPPKPQRSPIAKPVMEHFKPNVDRLAENKPRSKSVSSTNPPPLPPSIKPSTLRTHSGSRVEAIGRQFEQIMTKTSSLSPSSSVSSSSKRPTLC